mgnify:CR=1 FL=1
MTGQKIYHIVWLRTVAIIVVVLGHSIILYSSDWSIFTTKYDLIYLDIIKKIINFFQMPLFFSISGYLANWSTEFSFKKLVIKKAKRLLIPYMFCALLWMLPIRYLIDYQSQFGNSIGDWETLYKIIILGNDNGHLWYLPTLFLCFICHFLVEQVEKKYKKFNLNIVLGLISSLFYIVPLAVFPISYVNSFFQYYCWFVFGMWMAFRRNRIVQLNGKISLTITFAITIIALVVKTGIITSVMRYICGMSWLFFFYSFDIKKVNKVIVDIEENSFGIYLFHSPLVYITYTYFNNSNPILVISLNFFLCGGIAYLLTLVIRRTKARLLLGENIKTKGV